MKRCICCLETKEASAFSAAKGNRDGLHSHCRSCRSAQRRDAYSPKRKARPASPMGTWWCRRCELHKPLSDFYPLLVEGRNPSWCKQCTIASQKPYLARAEVRARNRELQKAARAKRRDQYNAEVRAYRARPEVAARLRSAAKFRRDQRPKHYAIIYQKAAKKAAASLTDAYVRRLIIKGTRGETRKSMHRIVPTSLICAKREHLRIHRHLRKEKP